MTRMGFSAPTGALQTEIEIEADGDCSRLTLRETGYGDNDDLLRRRDWLWSHWLVRLTATGAQFTCAS